MADRPPLGPSTPPWPAALRTLRCALELALQRRWRRKWTLGAVLLCCKGGEDGHHSNENQRHFRSDIYQIFLFIREKFFEVQKSKKTKLFEGLRNMGKPFFFSFYVLSV